MTFGRDPQGIRHRLPGCERRYLRDADLGALRLGVIMKGGGIVGSTIDVEADGAGVEGARPGDSVHVQSGRGWPISSG